MQIDTKKIVQIINFFAIKEGGEIDYTKVLKLIYFSDKYMLCKYGRMITWDRYSALKNGPIPSTTKDIVENVVKDFVFEYLPVSRTYLNRYLKHSSKWKISSVEGFDDDIFSDAEVNSLNIIYEKFGDETQWNLCEITHKFEEWKRLGVDGENKGFANIETLDLFLGSDDDDLNTFFNLNSEDLELKKNFFLETSNIQMCGKND